MRSAVRDCGHGGQIVCLYARKHGLKCCGAMQVRLDRHDTVKGFRKHLADDALTDSFAGMECGVLAHIGEIGRYQHQPSGAFAS